MVACLLVIGSVGYGVSRVHTSIDLLKLFDGGARILKDYAWLEQHLGRLVPMEIVLKFPRRTQEPLDIRQRMTIDTSAELSFLERMETVARAQRMIESRFGPEGQNVIGATMSAATFAPDLPEGGAGAGAFARRTVTNRELVKSRDAFLESGYLEVEEDGTELWRISVRVAAFQNVDYGTFAAELKEAIEPVLAAHQFRGRVLREVESQSEDGGFARAPVLLWQPETEGAGDADEAAPLTPSEVFKTALGESLLRLNMAVGELDADPAKATDSILDKFKELDAIVLLGQFTDTQVERLKDHGLSIVDARWPIVEEMISGPAEVRIKPETPFRPFASAVGGGR
jgi:hypothetical protein